MFAATDWFPLALAAMAVAGFSMVVCGVGTQTLLQSSVDEAMRGRVLALWGVVFRGGPAIGALDHGRAVGAVRTGAAAVVGGLCASRGRADAAPFPDLAQRLEAAPAG